ncbi:hypothetical protein PIB30_024543 [Stylosanthes scabra]|uniref:Retrotransposon gag domain-containing protein n=1 Tax=Stylosanthes scabra TaxID=79078 RepID=A0ABU6RA14_9FABA|nr:hypothetical protein [Stylosanthes scabra]
MTAPFLRPSVSPPWKKAHDHALVMPQRELGVSINLRGNDTLLTLYYLIRSGALAGGSLRFRKDFGHQLTLFPFSLRDRAKEWFQVQPQESITTWADLVAKFLTKFFPP